MAVDNNEFIKQLEEQTNLLRALSVEVTAAIKRAEDKIDLLRQGVPKEGERIFPPKG